MNTINLRIATFTQIGIGLFFISGLASAQMSIQGSTTLRAEVIDTDGLQAASPYPIEGGHNYLDLDASVEYQRSPYESISAQFTGVVNNSDYRFPDQGFSPERMSISYEKGDGAVPLRVIVGDYLGYFSYLTLQRSLKGAQLELQPELIDNALVSFIAFAGENDSEWRHLGIGHNTSMGASWSVDFENGARYLLNYVHNKREKNVLPFLGDLEQDVISLGYENQWSHEDFEVDIRAEAGFFDGDHDGAAGIAAARNEQAEGLYAEANGKRKDIPLSWVIRAEKYDKDYLPSGALVPAGRRSFETFANWRFENGLRLQGRLQNFKDGQGTAVLTKTTTRGLALTGSTEWLGRSVSSNVDIYRQDINSSAGLEAQNVIFNGRFSTSITDDWSARLELFHRDSDDQTAFDADTKERLLRLSADRQMNWNDMRLSISPGVSYRKINGGTGLEEIWPTINLRASMQAHQLSLFYGYQEQTFADLTGSGFTPGNLVETFSFDYSYRYQQHALGLEAQWYNRVAERTRDSRNLRLSAYWRYEFDEAELARLSGKANRSQKALVPTRTTTSSDLFMLAPWSNARQARMLMRAQGVESENAIRAGGFNVYEVQWIGDVDLRQRLAVEEIEGTVAITALIIEFDNLGNTDNALRSYNRVRNSLIRRYGSPDATFEDGAFGENFAAAVNRRQLIRIDEWQTAGGVLRFGIPRRLDGSVRMELQHKDSFGPVQDTLWSIEAVR